MLISSSKRNVLCIGNVLFGIILMISLTSCVGITTATFTATSESPIQQQEPFRTEPKELHIFVSFSGLDELEKGYVYFRTFSGQLPMWGSRPSKGDMRVVLPDRQGEIYFVTAEAEGYVSEPISFTIQLSGASFYLVENGQVTSSEVSDLKCQFELIIAPTNT